MKTIATKVRWNGKEILLKNTKDQQEVQHHPNRPATTYASDENSSAVMPSKATVPTKSSCSIATQGPFLHDPIHGPSSTLTRESEAREYIAPNVDKSSIPSDRRFRLQAVDIQVTILNFSSCSAMTSSVKALSDDASNIGENFSFDRLQWCTLCWNSWHWNCVFAKDTTQGTPHKSVPSSKTCTVQRIIS